MNRNKRQRSVPRSRAMLHVLTTTLPGAYVTLRLVWHPIKILILYFFFWKVLISGGIVGASPKLRM
ncbi:hypothetical protein NA56DRAFT_414725 [Hyaloscypha hepaticicola]|uniref:Uncharacterized protein n=1 Tax=Hyaloscypha hepaticicola TaxID=2082293 RepID=A0A2J6PI53_9HELO|nr:hypothetical protein NA56DRAFT_414725 [Hyaloscypha hepaticicola]